MWSLRLFVVWLLLLVHLLSIHGVTGFLPYRKTLLSQSASTKQQQEQEQQSHESRDALHHWRKRAVLGIRQWNHGWISPRVLSEQSIHQEPEFFVRKSLPADMGRASQILADGFFKDKTNWITYQWERLETYLSLESTFPRPNTPHVMFVACDSQSGQVLGMVELDARKKGKNKDSINMFNNNNNSIASVPYMCNVAVDDRHLRKGIATALIRHCESQVQQWHVESSGEIPCRVYLKVRSNNQAAIRMYFKLDYYTYTTDTLPEKDPKTGLSIYVMVKELENSQSPKSSSSPTVNDKVAAEHRPYPSSSSR